MIQRISLLGTGLIGGSLALAWQEQYPDCTIVGYDRPEVLEIAENRGAIDAKAADPITAVEGADVVVLATPLATVVKLLGQIADHLDEGTYVTDVASVKRPVLDQAEEVLPEHVHFLGGHPMAGAEEAGIEHADPLLFENAVYALCRPNNATESDDALGPLTSLIESTGARPLFLDADEHDHLVATVSHLPQLLAVALVNTVAPTEGDASSGRALQLAGGGFRDMTRIATSPFEMWRDILVGNEGPIQDALSAFERTLRRLRNRLLENDLDALEQAFDEARAGHDAVPADAKGFLHPLADVYVRVPDDPGVLHDLTGHVADAGLNIKDVELQKIREGTGGTFRIAFSDSQAATTAVDVLQDAGYEAWRP